MHTENCLFKFAIISEVPPSSIPSIGCLSRPRVHFGRAGTVGGPGETEEYPILLSKHPVGREGVMVRLAMADME